MYLSYPPTLRVHIYYFQVSYVGGPNISNHRQKTIELVKWLEAEGIRPIEAYRLNGLSIQIRDTRYNYTFHTENWQ